MRTDDIGFFWQDIRAARGKGQVSRVMPPIPDTGWTPPREFPRLDSAPWLCIDKETYDPNLLTHGPGWARGDGHIVGVAVAAPGASWYFPVRHTVEPEHNMDPEHVFSWLRDTAKAHGKKPVMGANLIYDLGWGMEEGVVWQGKAYDVQFAEALLRETGNVNLEELGQNWLGKGKETSFLYQWAADYYGGKPDGGQRKNIYRCPPRLVGPYAQGDVELPAQLMPLQWAELERQGLLDLFDLETRLIPLLIAMRRAGVSVDLDHTERAVAKLKEREIGHRDKLRDMVGFDVNTDAGESMQRAFNKLGIPIPKDPKTGRPSFNKVLLADIDHPFIAQVSKLKSEKKVRKDFLESFILNKHVKGKLHGSFNPLRGDDSGTRSGRFSGQNPNLQQAPSRDEDLAPMVRGSFVPDPGHRRWRRYDYDQIEYRFNAHYAVGQGSDALRAQYNADPKTDYHVNAQRMVERYARVEIPRKPIKNFNFGMTYGMGRGKMIRTVISEMRALGVKAALDGEQLYNAYHEALPFSKATLDHYSDVAQRSGLITTILGRRSRFDLWEPAEWDDDAWGLPYNKALAAYGSNIRRSKTHKALNRLLQGSSADKMKKAMVILWESGVFADNVAGVPRLTVHDELDFSEMWETPPEAWDYIQRTMETAIPLRIPIRVSLELGPNWGNCEEVD